MTHSPPYTGEELDGLRRWYWGLRSRLSDRESHEFDEGVRRVEGLHRRLLDENKKLIRERDFAERVANAKAEANEMLAEENDALEAENAALREDKARLDWLEDNSEWYDAYLEDFQEYVVDGTPTLRAAIDAARAGGEG